MKKITTLLALFALVQTAMAALYPQIEIRTVGVPSYSTGCAGVSPCIFVCADEDMEVRFNPVDWSDYIGQNPGYTEHFYEVRDPFTYAVIQTFGPYVGNSSSTFLSMPPGWYEIQAKIMHGTQTFYSDNSPQFEFRDVTPTAATLSAGPYCAGSPITVDGAFWALNCGYSWNENGRIDMGDGTVIPGVFLSAHAGNPCNQMSFGVQNASHTYAQPGTYDVTVYFDYQCGTRGTTTTITVGPAPAFVGPSQVCVGAPASFSNFTNCLSSIDPGSLAWSFGGGGSSTKNNPTHVYSNPGNYTVHLSFTVGGTLYSTSSSITVVAAPEVNLGPDQTFCANSLFGFPELDAGNPGSTYQWAHEGDPVGTDQTLATSAWGQYCVTVTNAEGCVSVDCMDIIPDYGMNPDPAFGHDRRDDDGDCVSDLWVYPVDTRPGVHHQWWLWKNQPPGTSTGGVNVLPSTTNPGITNFWGTSWGGTPILPEPVNQSTWYYLQHGVWTACDPWVDERLVIFYACRQGEFLSLSEEEIQEFNLYPNPASAWVHVTGLSGTVDVSIYGLDGRLVRSETRVSNDGLPINVDIDDLTSGVYLLQATSDNGASHTERLVVK